MCCQHRRWPNDDPLHASLPSSMHTYRQTPGTVRTREKDRPGCSRPESNGIPPCGTFRSILDGALASSTLWMTYEEFIQASTTKSHRGATIGRACSET